MKDVKDSCRVAVVQSAAVMFDKKKSTEKCVKLIAEAAENKPDLIVFPELIIPGYPFNMNFGFSVGRRTKKGREDWAVYHDNSILIPGPETKLLGAAAKKAKAYVSIGVSERVEETGTLYNSNIIFNPKGEIECVHRKLKPTGSERVCFGDAQDHFFPVVDTKWGKIGNLICWESYMPLARVALYDKGVSILISCNTNDNPEWHDTIKHIAIEGHCYYINCDMIINKKDYPEINYPEAVEELPDIPCRGGSCVIDPYGHYMSEPVWDKETIIYEDLDMNQVAYSRMEFDACGHYARPDVLELNYLDI